MGCCVSSPSPYPAQQANSSSRAINSSEPQSQATFPRPSTPASNLVPGIPHPSHIHSRRHRQHGSSRPLSYVLNRPLKPHVWRSDDRTWTRTELDRERVEFFDTRVTGRAEIWQVIHAALEILWNGGSDGDQDGGWATAQQILDAAGVTVPTGDMASGVYDVFGAFYQLPEYIVSDPINMIESDQAERSGPSSEDEEELLRRGEEDGQKPLEPEDMMTVKARRSDGQAQDLCIDVPKGCSVRLLIERFTEEAKISPPQGLKLAYLGRILDPKRSLESQGWRNEHVLNALVFG